jgi:hypothetical protein
MSMTHPIVAAAGHESGRGAAPGATSQATVLARSRRRVDSWEPLSRCATASRCRTLSIAAARCPERRTGSTGTNGTTPTL